MFNIFLVLYIILWSYVIYGKPVDRTGNAGVSDVNNLDSKSLGFLFDKGYLTMSSASVGQVQSKKKVTNALKRFQEFVGIPVSGIVDKLTTEFMLKPRCGMPDIRKGNIRRRKRRYNHEGTTWKNTRLTWALENHNNDGISDYKIRRLLAIAFSKWEEVTNIYFRELVNQPINSAIIRVRFVQGSHGDPYPFDGYGGTLAHAFFPHNNKGLSGDVHFDDAEEFTTDPNAGRHKRKFLWVAVHEIGHSIGLDHSRLKGAIMFPYYIHFEGSDVDLTFDDIRGIQTIYGGKIPQERTTTTTTKIPTQTPAVVCTDVMKAAYVGNNNKIHVINNDKFYVLFQSKDGVEKGPVPVNSIFKDVNKIDTVFRRRDRYLVLFHGDKFSVYNDRKQVIRRPRLINDGFQQIHVKLENVDAAFIWPENKKLYIFKGENYWRLSQLRSRDYIADYGYPKSISANWEGLPKTIDSGFQWTNGIMYFTKGQYYYRWNKWRQKVHSGYPIKLSRSFLNCNIAKVRR